MLRTAGVALLAAALGAASAFAFGAASLGPTEEAVLASKLPRIRLHDLRHTHATLALGTNIHPKVVSERLGHSTVAFTLDVYSHCIPALAQDAADRVAALVFAAE